MRFRSLDIVQHFKQTIAICCTNIGNKVPNAFIRLADLLVNVELRHDLVELLKRTKVTTKKTRTEGQDIPATCQVRSCVH